MCGVGKIKELEADVLQELLPTETVTMSIISSTLAINYSDSLLEMILDVIVPSLVD